MPSACAASRKAAPARAADPIVERTIEYRPFCPPELTAGTPAPVPDYAGPPIEVPRLYLEWLAAHLGREALIELRLDDGRARCPGAEAPAP